jgi:hypothetical protein
MTDPVDEHAYRWFRRCIFAATLAAIIVLLVLCFVL